MVAGGQTPVAGEKKELFAVGFLFWIWE